MTQSKRPHVSSTVTAATYDAEKQRLFEALRKLQQEGVRIIDDRQERVRIFPPIENQSVRPDRTSSILFNELESMSFLEDQVGSNPYNKIS